MNNDSLTSFNVNKNGSFIIRTNPTMLFIISSIFSTIDGFNIVANLTVVSALVRSRKIISNDVTTNNRIATMMMTSLALSDGLIGVLVMPPGIVELINNGKWYLGQELCVIRLDLNNMLNSVSIFHIACMAIDRYIVVCKPLRYRVLRAKVGFVMIGAAWSLPGILMLMPTINGWHQSGQEALVPLFDEDQVCIRIFNKIILNVSILLSFYVPLVATYTLYFLILRDIRNFSKRRRNYLKEGVSKLSRTTFPRTSTREPHQALRVSAIELTPNVTEETRVVTDRSFEITLFTERDIPIVERPHTNQNLRAYKTIGSILVCFTMCWLPIGLAVVPLALVDYVDLPFWFCVMLNWFNITNSAINPVLYCGNKSVRRSVQSLLHCLKKFMIPQR